MKEAVFIVASVHIVNVSDMYIVRKYAVVDDDLEDKINAFCKEGKYEVVSSCAYNGWSIVVIYKETKNENKSKGDN